MLGLKRVLFPVSSPELSIDFVTQRGPKRKRNVHHQEPPPTFACRPKQKHFSGVNVSIVDGGILARVPEKSRNEARRQRLQREAKRKMIPRTSRATGSVLMNKENAKKVCSNRGKDLKTTKQRHSRADGLMSMDSLAGMVQSGKRTLSPVEKKVPRQVQRNPRQCKQARNVTMKVSRLTQYESKIDSMVSCCEQQTRFVHKIHPLPQASVLESAFFTETIQSAKTTTQQKALQKKNEQQSMIRQPPPKELGQVVEDPGRPHVAQLEKDNRFPTTCTPRGKLEPDKDRNLFNKRPYSLISSSLGIIVTSETPEEAPLVSFISVSHDASCSERESQENSSSSNPSKDLGSSQKSDLIPEAPIQNIADNDQPTVETDAGQNRSNRQDLNPESIDNEAHDGNLEAPKAELEIISEDGTGLRPNGASANANEETEASIVLRSRRSLRLSSRTNTATKEAEKPEEYNNTHQKVEENAVVKTCNLRRSKRQRSMPCLFGTLETNEEELQSRRRRHSGIHPLCVLRYSIGTKVRKEFKYHGWFDGMVDSFDRQSAFYKIKYEDGDIEEVDEAELQAILKIDVPNDPKTDCNGTSVNVEAEGPEHDKTIPKSKTRGVGPQDHDEYEQDDIFNATPMPKFFVSRSLDEPSLPDTVVPTISDNQNDPVGIDEDGIFHATPIQTLPVAPENENVDRMDIEIEVVNRSTMPKRARKRPQRFGVYEREVEDVASNLASSQKKPAIKKTNPRTGMQKKKRVRISSEGLNDRETNEMTSQLDNQHWTSLELDALIQAHKDVDPKSSTFWEDVSKIVITKLPEECIERWFSLAKTPVAKKKMSKKLTTPAGIPLDRSHKIAATDDIFNATPMRGILQASDVFDDASSMSLDQIESISKIAYGSAIKLFKRQDTNLNVPFGNSSLCDYPQGYKTYIKNMGREVRQKDQKTKNGKKDFMPPSLRIDRNLQERSENGDVAMNCLLSPGGTLQLNANSDANGEDMSYYYCDECLDEDM